MMPMKIVQLSRPPTPLVHLCPKLVHPLDLGRPILNVPHSPNDNQSIKRNHNPRMTIICYQVLPSSRLSFSVSTQWFYLAFSLTSFHLAEFSLSAFSWLYTLMWAVVHKYHEMSFIYNYSLFLVLILHSASFICTAWKRKQTMEQQIHCSCERTNLNKNKTKSCQIQIDHTFYCSI